jgi:aryl-alcohol dehydrogenase-like predicted oxidoreductase
MVRILQWFYNHGDMLMPIALWHLEGTFNCMKQAYDCGVNFFDTAER